MEQHRDEKCIKKFDNKYQKRYVFSGKIICGECGNTFKRRIHGCRNRKYAAWCCNTHLSNIDACSMLYVRDDDLKRAFLTMMNKLIYSKNFLLRPLLHQLKNAGEGGSIQRIHELETKLLHISEQRQTLQRLMAQGYIDQILFIQQKNELMAQTEEYNSEIELLKNNGDSYNKKINELEKLINFTERMSMFQEFDDNLFIEYADHIIVYNRSEVGFELKCGLTLRERM